MAFATVYIEETQVGVVADSLGRYTIPNLCSGTYHVQFSHIGCEGKIVYVSLNNDTLLNVRMHHHNELVDEVVIHDHHHEHGAQTSVSITSRRVSFTARPLWTLHFISVIFQKKRQRKASQG